MEFHPGMSGSRLRERLGNGTVFRLWRPEEMRLF